jgi:hypothetical protein
LEVASPAVSLSSWRGKAGCPLPRLVSFPVGARAVPRSLGRRRPCRVVGPVWRRSGYRGRLVELCGPWSWALIAEDADRADGARLGRTILAIEHRCERDAELEALIFEAALQRGHAKCWARCLFISNMVTLSLPNTFRSLSSARISRRFSGFCKLCDLM